MLESFRKLSFSLSFKCQPVTRSRRVKNLNGADSRVNYRRSPSKRFKMRQHYTLWCSSKRIKKTRSTIGLIVSSNGRKFSLLKAQLSTSARRSSSIHSLLRLPFSAFFSRSFRLKRFVRQLRMVLSMACVGWLD